MPPVPSISADASQSDKHLASGVVIANRGLCREHFELLIRVGNDFPLTSAGQFIQLGCGDEGSIERADTDERAIEWIDGRFPTIDGVELRSPQAFLRRPFSLAGRVDRADGVELSIIHRVVGRGTDWLSRLSVGDRVDLIGPLGNRFTMPFENQPAILVGGGVGIPPMLYLAEVLKTQGCDAGSVAFCGATSRDLLPLTIDDSQSTSVPSRIIEEFDRHGISSVITTDDGSLGRRGFVTDALADYLDEMLQQNGTFRPMLYTCGPEGMMQRVADIAARRDLPVQIAVERAMACGMGTCQSCCIRVRAEASNDQWRYALACTEGPVFMGKDLLW